MGNVASRNATGNHCQLTKEHEGSQERTQRGKPTLHRSRSLIDSLLWSQQWVMVQWEKVNVPLPVMAKCRLAALNRSRAQSDTPRLGWNPARSGSDGGCAQGYSNFHRSLKIACPLSWTKKKRALLIITALCWRSEASGLRMCHFLGGAWETVDTTLAAQNKNHGNNWRGLFCVRVLLN